MSVGAIGLASGSTTKVSREVKRGGKVASNGGQEKKTSDREPIDGFERPGAKGRRCLMITGGAGLDDVPKIGSA